MNIGAGLGQSRSLSRRRWIIECSCLSTADLFYLCLDWRQFQWFMVERQAIVSSDVGLLKQVKRLNYWLMKIPMAAFLSKMSWWRSISFSTKETLSLFPSSLNRHASVQGSDLTIGSMRRARSTWIEPFIGARLRIELSWWLLDRYSVHWCVYFGRIGYWSKEEGEKQKSNVWRTCLSNYFCAIRAKTKNPTTAPRIAPPIVKVIQKTVAEEFDLILFTWSSCTATFNDFGMARRITCLELVRARKIRELELITVARRAINASIDVSL